MNWKKYGGLAVYVLLVEAIAYYYASADMDLFKLGVPFLGGVLLAAGTVLRIELYDVPIGALRGEAVASGVLLVSPLLWYTLYGCVIGCPG